MPRVSYRELAGDSSSGKTDWLLERPQMPYLLPFLAFLIVMVPGSFGHLAGIDWEKLWLAWQPFLYPLKTILAAVLLWRLWNYYTPIRWTHLPLGILAGLLGTVIWIGTEYFCQSIGFSKPPAPSKLYNPDLMLADQYQRYLYLCIRIVGPTLVVPVMEELFFRDFLMRALITGGRFDEVPIGAFSWLSLIGMSLLFGINHAAEWPEGILYGLLMGLLLIRTKSLGACIVAHGITNWTLYLYVVYKGDWQFM